MAKARPAMPLPITRKSDLNCFGFMAHHPHKIFMDRFYDPGERLAPESGDKPVGMNDILRPVFPAPQGHRREKGRVGFDEEPVQGNIRGRVLKDASPLR